MTHPTLAAWLQHHATSRPAQPFIIHPASDTTLTYAEAWAHAQHIAGVLHARGLKKKSRVVLLSHNHWLYFPLLVACELRRATLVPLAPDLHKDDLGAILAETDPALVLTGPGVTPTVPVESMPLGQLPDEPSELPELDVTTVHPRDVCLLIYTSGTTGNSKAVMLSNSNLVADGTALAARYQLTAQDRLYCVLPTSYMNAVMMTGIAPMVGGATVVLGDVLSFRTAKHYWRDVERYEITICSLVPSIMALLLRLSPRGTHHDITRVRFGFSGAAPLSAALWQQFESHFGFPIYQGYGLTETTCWATSTPPGDTRRYDTVGTPLPHACEVVIDTSRRVRRSDHGLEQATPSPETGEVLIRGPIVSSGYFRDKRLTRQRNRPDGFHRTGDLGHIDADGHLHITGRLKDIIIRNGSNIPASAVEEVLCRHPSVRECKVVGIDDPLVGERVYAATVTEDDTPPNTLRAWAHEHLSPALRPDVVVSLPRLPRGAAGKVTVQALRKLLTGERSQDIFDALNSWKFKRSQPFLPDKIRASIQAALLTDGEVLFLTYWGCGPRAGIAPVDLQTMDRLCAYMELARWPAGTRPRMTLILTDVHARNNRIPDDRIASYYGDIQRAAAERGLDTIWLSDIWRDAGLDVDTVRSATETTEFETTWQDLPLRDNLIAQAGKHLEGSTATEAAAQFYYMACQRESQVIAARFEGAIFTSYNHPDFDFLLPPLPKVYLYSFREGTSVKPWFVDETAES